MSDVNTYGDPGADHPDEWNRPEPATRCRHLHCRQPIERDTVGWHHTAHKRIPCLPFTVAEP